jgi:hypothetical protein
MMQLTTLARPLWTLALVLTLAGCGISQPVNVSGLSRVVGDDLPGAMGKTVTDQDKIDLTMARLCRTRVIPQQSCERHTVASAARRAELRQ